MNGYQLDHKFFEFEASMPESLPHYSKRPYLICRVNADQLYARIVTSYRKGKAIHTLTRLIDTPHYAFLNGDNAAYVNYLESFGKDVGYTIEHSIENFNEIINSNEGYLEGKYGTNFIICETVSSFFSRKIVILDGVHRAALLLNQGVKSFPVALIVKKNGNQLRQYLNDYKDDFPEWYTPVEIGGTVIHERTYPEFKERPEFLNNRERGKSKWDFIIRKNLPSIQNKRVCDIGCNIGLYSHYLAQLGASRVDGYDRGTSIIQPTNPNLPRQNVVQQAYFVKNLFKLSNVPTYDHVHFTACDLVTLDFSKLDYDMLFSCCVLYHFKDKFEEIIKGVSSNIPEIFLQTNLGHKGADLSEYVSIEYHEKILKKCGYEVRIDAPEGYNYPVIYGKKNFKAERF